MNDTDFVIDRAVSTVERLRVRLRAMLADHATAKELHAIDTIASDGIGQLEGMRNRAIPQGYERHFQNLFDQAERSEDAHSVSYFLRYLPEAADNWLMEPPDSVREGDIVVKF